MNDWTYAQARAREATEIDQIPKDVHWPISSFEIYGGLFSEDNGRPWQHPPSLDCGACGWALRPTHMINT
jgi:hypothetical protein